MPLIACNECQNAISAHAPICPHCGHWYHTPEIQVVPGVGWMWRIFWAIVFVLLVPVIVAVVITIILLISGLAIGLGSK